MVDPIARSSKSARTETGKKAHGVADAVDKAVKTVDQKVEHVEKAVEHAEKAVKADVEHVIRVTESRMMHIFNHPVLKHPATIPVSAGIVAFVGGIGIGYILARKRTGKKVDKILEVENDTQVPLVFPPGSHMVLPNRDEAEEFVAEKLETATLNGTEDEAGTSLVIDAESYEKIVERDLSTEDETVTHSVFDGVDNSWDICRAPATKATGMLAGCCAILLICSFV